MSASTPCHHSTGLDESHFKSLSDQAVDIDHLRKMLVGEMKDFLERCKKETCTYINDSYLQGMKRAIIQLEDWIDSSRDVPEELNVPNKLVNKKESGKGKSTAIKLHRLDTSTLRGVEASSSYRSEPSPAMSQPGQEDRKPPSVPAPSPPDTVSLVPQPAGTSSGNHRPKDISPKRKLEARADDTKTQNVDEARSSECANKSIVSPKSEPQEDRILTRQKFERNYTAVGSISGNTPRYEPRPRHANIPPTYIYYTSPNSRPYPTYEDRHGRRYEHPYLSSSRYHDDPRPHDRRRGSPNPRTSRNRKEYGGGSAGPSSRRDRDRRDTRADTRTLHKSSHHRTHHTSNDDRAKRHHPPYPPPTPHQPDSPPGRSVKYRSEAERIQEDVEESSVVSTGKRRRDEDALENDEEREIGKRPRKKNRGA